MSINTICIHNTPSPSTKEVKTGSLLVLVSHHHLYYFGCGFVLTVAQPFLYETATSFESQLCEQGGLKFQVQRY